MVTRVLPRMAVCSRPHRMDPHRAYHERLFSGSSALRSGPSQGQLPSFDQPLALGAKRRTRCAPFCCRRMAIPIVGVLFSYRHWSPVHLAVNSATYMWRSRRFATTDSSKDSFWVALLTFGEGWHNNHHAHPQSSRHGLAWFEFDRLTCTEFLALRMLDSCMGHQRVATQFYGGCRARPTSPNLFRAVSTVVGLHYARAEVFLLRRIIVRSPRSPLIGRVLLTVAVRMFLGRRTIA